MSLARTVGAAAVASSALYVVSDVVEAAQGGFSDAQLALTLVAEAAVPAVVLGLYAVQRPPIGRLGLVAALGYAYAYAYFTGTVVYALAEGTPDYAQLTDDLGPWMLAHGTVMVVAGASFGAAVIRARVLPRWTGVALIAGVVLVAATQSAAEPVQVGAAAIRALAFAGMGAAVLSDTRARGATASPGGGRGGGRTP